MAFRFEDLQVWQKALDLDEQINQLTKTFPKDELYILVSQLKRAADSVVLNISEGSTGQSKAVFKVFLSYSYVQPLKSLAVCLYQRSGGTSTKPTLRSYTMNTKY